MEPPKALPHAASYGFPLVEKRERARPSLWRVAGLIVVTMVVTFVVYVSASLLAGAAVGKVFGIFTEAIGLGVIFRVTRRPGQPAAGH